MLPDSQQKSMLSITGCTVEDGVVSLNPAQTYELMLNPKSMDRKYKIAYSKEFAIGTTGIQQKYNATHPEDLAFSFVIDGTGVVKTTTVSSELKSLCAVIYVFKGNRHEPNRVCIVWGALKYYGRLKDMKVNYTLFLPNGDPLRAEVSLRFGAFISPEEDARRTNKTSPDLTHLVEVKAGDTLPLLCNRIYRDPSYYPEVARINNIVNIRNLTPGTRLRFPPLR